MHFDYILVAVRFMKTLKTDKEKFKREEKQIDMELIGNWQGW